MNLTCVEFTLNGKPKSISIDPRVSLLAMLRDLGYTSVKQGCAVGECGACTVLVDGVPVDSCIYLALWVSGKEVRTTEGEVKDNILSIVQQAYVDAGAVQCGFCTPGLVMTTTALVEKYRGKKICRDTVRKELAGNLCRCTGYEKVIDAVLASLESRPQCDGAGGCGCSKGSPTA